MEESKNKNFILEVSLDKEGRYRLQARLKNKKENGGIIKDNGTLYLFEWQEYRIIGKKAFTLRRGDENFEAEKINENTYIATFQFKNYVGKSFIEIFENDQWMLKKPVEVLSKKVLDIMSVKGRSQKIVDAHREFYNALFEDILRASSSLPFSLSAPTAFVAGEGDEPVNELFALHYLRSNRERILEAFETVLRRVKRRLVVEEEWMKAHEVDEITPETLISIIQHPEYLAPAGEGILIAEHLNRYAPTRVLGVRKYETPDTPENRFAKYFLNLLIDWSERVLEVFRKNPSADLGSIKELLSELEFLRSDGLWEEVGEMEIFPYTSQTLLKGDGYRDLLELYREFTSYIPFFEELQKAMDNKDIAKLYEYWAFFRLVEELGGILGRKRLKIHVLPTGELSERGDIYAEFDNGWRLYYNKRLTPKKWSYSVTLRPDFSLFNGDPRRGAELIGVFDAKFKLDVVDEPREIEEFDEETEIVEETGKYETWAKLEDIYKMHTYRDALGCKFAIVVYPGKKSLFFEKSKRHRDTLADTGATTQLLLVTKVDRTLNDKDYLTFKLYSFDVSLNYAFNLENLLKMEGVGYLKLIPEVGG